MNRAHVHPVARCYSTLTAAPALLPGEDTDHYQLIRDAVVREIDPQTTIEWLFVNDLVELSWDILRYRRLRQKVLQASRELSIQAILERIDLAGIEDDDRPLARQHIKQNVVAWRTDPQAQTEIESRLVAHRFDTESTDRSGSSRGTHQAYALAEAGSQNIEDPPISPTERSLRSRIKKTKRTQFHGGRMTSLRQIEANRRNAQMSTGPTTEEGKRKSRQNAVRHGLTAETVIDVLEDAEDYASFELAVTSDYDAQSAVERELVLRLASLLWRLRRATSIEAGLFKAQTQHLFGSRGQRQHFSHDDRDINSTSRSDGDLVRAFVRLNRLSTCPLDRLSRYEAALWRQACQVLFTLQCLTRRKPWAKLNRL